MKVDDPDSLLFEGLSAAPLPSGLTKEGKTSEAVLAVSPETCELGWGEGVAHQEPLGRNSLGRGARWQACGGTEHPGRNQNFCD